MQRFIVEHEVTQDKRIPLKLISRLPFTERSAISETQSRSVGIPRAPEVHLREMHIWRMMAHTIGWSQLPLHRTLVLRVVDHWFIDNQCQCNFPTWRKSKTKAMRKTEESRKIMTPPKAMVNTQVTSQDGHPWAVYKIRSTRAITYERKNETCWKSIE